MSYKQPLYGGANLLRSVRYMLVPQVGVARRGTETTMSEKPPNHRQRPIAHGSMAGERVAQIVKSDLGQTSPITDARPIIAQFQQWCTAFRVPEHPGDIPGLGKGVEHSSCVVTQPNPTGSGFLSRSLSRLPFTSGHWSPATSLALHPVSKSKVIAAATVDLKLPSMA